MNPPQHVICQHPLGPPRSHNLTSCRRCHSGQCRWRSQCQNCSMSSYFRCCNSRNRRSCYSGRPSPTAESECPSYCPIQRCQTRTTDRRNRVALGCSVPYSRPCTEYRRNRRNRRNRTNRTNRRSQSCFSQTYCV